MHIQKRSPPDINTEIQLLLPSIRQNLTSQGILEEVNDAAKKQLSELVKVLGDDYSLSILTKKLRRTILHLVSNYQDNAQNRFAHLNNTLDQLNDLIPDWLEMFKTGEKVIEERFPHLVDIPIQALEAHWHKSYRTFRQCKEVLIKIQEIQQGCSPAENEKLEILKRRHLVWCFHFLVRGAKIPILDLFRPPQHLPFIDFSIDNEPSYYRGDGGVIMGLFLDQLGIDRSNVHCLLVRNQCFEELIKVCCENIECKIVDHRNINSAFIEKYKGKEKFFVNMSNIFENYATLKEKIDVSKSCWQMVGSFKNVAVGGKTSNRDQDMFICFPRQDDTLSEWITNEFQNYQGANGYYPDMVTLKHSLCQNPFSIEEFYLNYPFISKTKNEKINSIFTDNIIATTSSKEFEEIMNLLNSSHFEKSRITSIYMSILKKLLVSLDVNTPLKDSLRPLVVKDFSKIKKRLEMLKTILDSNDKIHLKFHHSLQQIYLLFETVLHLMNFLKEGGKQKERYSVVDVIQKLSPNAATLLENGIQKDSFTLTSGMSSLGCIANSLTDTLYNGLNAKGLFLEGCYYEIFEEGGLKDVVKRKINFLDENAVSAQSLLEEDSAPLASCDILFCDLHPNFVTLPSVATTPVKNLVLKALSTRDGSRPPFTLVLDVSTTLFFHPEIAVLIEDKDITKAISEGKLIVVTAASLAKFPSVGLDKYTGGALQVYSAQGSHSSLIKFLKIRSDKDPFSDEVLKFFSLLFSHCSSEILGYFKKVRDNTDYVYEQLRTKGLVGSSNHALKIGERKGHGIMMLGIQFDEIIRKMNQGIGTTDNQSLVEESSENVELENNQKMYLTLFMQYYLFAKCAARELPIAIRSSFGFPCTTFIECSTALRMTVGLEDVEMLDEYVDVFVKHNQEIDEQLNDPESLKKFKEAMKGIDVDVHEMKKKFARRHATIVESASCNNFVDFILASIKTAGS